MNTSPAAELQGIRLREAVTERQLIHGYSGISRSTGRNVPRIEPCACGGSIYVDIQSDPIIQAAVRRHQQTGRHSTWSIDEYGS